jgi:BlaI family penicillinase repressor
MKRNKKIPDLTRAEFDILRILWKKAPLSVRELYDEIKQSSQWAYTTTKTMMDRMVKKGLLKRVYFHGVYLYKPLVTKTQGLVKWIEFFADRVMELDYDSILALYGKSQALSKDELEELSNLLENNRIDLE